MQNSPIKIVFCNTPRADALGLAEKGVRCSISLLFCVQSPLIPCNWNFESGNTSSLRHADVTPVYEMVEEFYVNLDGSQAGLYQVIMQSLAMQPLTLAGVLVMT